MLILKLVLLGAFIFTVGMVVYTVDYATDDWFYSAAVSIIGVLLVGLVIVLLLRGEGVI